MTICITKDAFSFQDRTLKHFVVSVLAMELSKDG